MYSEVYPFRGETTKDELHTLSETIKKEKIKEKTVENHLDLSVSTHPEIVAALNLLLQNKWEYKSLKLITVPESFIYKNDAYLKLVLDVLDTFDKISIKTDKWYDVPRPPKSL